MSITERLERETLNLLTAEFYEVIEHEPEIAESTDDMQEAA